MCYDKKKLKKMKLMWKWRVMAIKNPQNMKLILTENESVQVQCSNFKGNDLIIK